MENKILVIYKSKYGSTKKYANWISEELNCKCIEIGKMENHDLKNYDFIIYGEVFMPVEFME